MAGNEMPRKIDPITVEVIYSSLQKAAEEMRVTVERTAYSTVISEALDFCCAILGRDCSMVAETAGIPVFLGNLPAATEEIHKVIGFENLDPGDVILMNDPYSGGFSHNPDVTVIAPVFHEGEIIFFTGFKGHTLDMGGIYAGGWYNNTTETYQEGIMFPPTKLYVKGQPNDDIIRLIRRNSRVPDLVLGDIRAMVSAVRVGAARLVAVVEKYGRQAVTDAIEEIFRSSEAVARQAVAEIPDGVYTGHFYADGDGDDWAPISDKLLIKMTITVTGDEMTVDMTGSAPPSAGPMNCPTPTAISQIRNGFKTVTTPHLPNNSGCFKPLKIIIPENSIFSPRIPHSTSLVWGPSNSLGDLMLKVLTERYPEKSRGGHYGDVCADFVFGTDPRTGRFYILAEPTAGGWGGKSYDDGDTRFSYSNGDTHNVPVEITEVQFPIRVLRYALTPDTGGPGKFRGGLGVYKDYMPVDHDAGVTATFERRKYSPPWGVHGGRDGVPNKIVVERRDGSTQEYGKITGLSVKNGEVISFRGGGGGGFGDPLDRNPERVRWDVRNEYISLESAARDYGVSLDPHTGEVDFARTEELRRQLRQERTR